MNQADYSFAESSFLSALQAFRSNRSNPAIRAKYFAVRSAWRAVLSIVGEVDQVISE